MVPNKCHHKNIDSKNKMYLKHILNNVLNIEGEHSDLKFKYI